MNMKKTVSLLLCLVLLAALFAGCGKKDGKTVSVQSVQLLSGRAGVGLFDRFGGIVEAGSTVPVEKDPSLAVKELHVAVGDTVGAGDVLFEYDVDALALELEKRRVELDQLNASIDTKTRQIASLEREKATVGADAQIEYTIQIQELELDVSEAKLSIDGKQREIEQLEQLTENAQVCAPSEGRVLTLNEPDTDNYDPSKPYLTLAALDSCRVKGTVNEQYAYTLYEGMPMLIRSRVDEDVIWRGVVERVDLETPVQSNNDGTYYYGPVDEMTGSSKYPFYVTPEDDTGLMLGQHVYLEPDVGQSGGFTLPADWICDADGAAWVWAAGSGDRLEKRSVTLGAHDPDSDTWEILSGLTASDFLAFPDESCSVGAAVVYYSEDSFSSPDAEAEYAENGLMPGEVENGGAGFSEEEGFYGEDVWIEPAAGEEAGAVG